MQDIGGKVLAPLLPRPWKPVIVHGDFRFGALICNELTNIEYRQPLRGRVYAVVVVEWNQDTETFASLVEASALDIHAFIIQCNNMQFGDSRIRCPAKEPYHRDEVRIKGGLEDYFVIGSIDVGALRAYQTTHVSPGRHFKPVPTGFKIDPKRKRLTGGGD
jgi:predicted amidohydrolase